jgi:transposase-like protein
MAKRYSEAFKQKMVGRLTGAGATKVYRLAAEVGVSQDSLSRWLQAARSLPTMPRPKVAKKHTTADKIRIMGEAAKLNGDELVAFLSAENATLGEVEQWKLALDQSAGAVANKRIRSLERELARKDKALAEAAALLILQKKVAHLWEDEDDDTSDPTEK